MRYWILSAVFFCALVLKASADEAAVEVAIASEDEIPAEAHKVPVRERKLHLAAAKHHSAPAELVTDHSYSSPRHSLLRPSLTPLLGTAIYTSGWNNHIGNAFSTALAFEVPVTDLISGEIEGGYGSFNITHSGLMKDFNQYWLGGGAKIYVTRYRLFRPYMGIGLSALNYEHMYTDNGKLNRWMGVSQVSAGVDMGVFDRVSLGVRGSWHKPLFNRPHTVDNGVFSHPAHADAAAMNTDFFRLMGTVKVEL